MHSIVKFVHITTYPGHVPVHFSAQGEVINLSMQLIHGHTITHLRFPICPFPLYTQKKETLKENGYGLSFVLICIHTSSTTLLFSSLPRAQH